MPKLMFVKVTRNQFILISAIVAALIGLVEAVLPVYVTQPTIEGALAAFIPQVGTAVTAYLASEEQTAPTS